MKMPIYFPLDTKAFLGGSKRTKICEGIYVASIPNTFGPACIVIDLDRLTAKSHKWLKTRGIETPVYH